MAICVTCSLTFICWIQKRGSYQYIWNQLTSCSSLTGDNLNPARVTIPAWDFNPCSANDCHQGLLSPNPSLLMASANHILPPKMLLLSFNFNEKLAVLLMCIVCNHEVLFLLNSWFWHLLVSSRFYLSPTLKLSSFLLHNRNIWLDAFEGETAEVFISIGSNLLKKSKGVVHLALKQLG